MPSSTSTTSSAGEFTFKSHDLNLIIHSHSDCFGFHLNKIQHLKSAWETFKDGSRCKIGSTVLQCLLDREEGFYFSDSFFDIPGMFITLSLLLLP